MRPLDRPAVAALLFFALAVHATDAESQTRRRPEQPEVRQPTLIEPVAPVAPAVPSRAPASASAVRPAAPLEDQQRFYDTESPAYALLQKAHEALAGFPVDPAGFVDWIAAAATGRISPRAAWQDKPEPARNEDEVILRNTKEMPPVVFPHAPHSALLGCASCHPAPFAEKAGATAITMERIFRGEACGKCHGKVAFPAWENCGRCHREAAAGRTAGATSR